jgi:hypothetical protein
MYELARWSKSSGKLSGFVHVPLVEETADAKDTVEGLARILGFLTRL